MVLPMELRDRIRRWWSPAKWRDEHPEISESQGFAIDAERGELSPNAIDAIKATDATVFLERH